MKWEQAWLEYKKLDNQEIKKYFSKVLVKAEGECIVAALDELDRMAKKCFDQEVERVEKISDNGIVIALDEEADLDQEGYTLKEKNGLITVTGGSQKGVLYGVFALIRNTIVKQDLNNINIYSVPSNPLRFINHWDNIDGSIERGYSGNSFFFENAQVIINERTVDYARLMASIGINSVVINNVNVLGQAKELITERYYEKISEIALIFRQYGIRLFLSLNYAAPMNIGGLDTTDPLDEAVIDWWNKKIQEVYANVPNLGGFLVKADSEGQPGPFAYGRDHAQGANVLARAVKPHGGIIVWRCFVYNCQQDWRDLKTDRARAAYDNFIDIDGKFDDNVILQVKNGPMDFQIREPISPLIGAMPKTNQIMEVQIAQEYTGQQIDICYLIPMFKDILSFHTHCAKKDDKISDIISGKTYDHILCGMAAVTNTGNDENWTGHDFAAANLYGYGRLAWNTNLTAEEIGTEWIVQTFGQDESLIEASLKILMMSRLTYEKYTSPLGIGWMVNPHHHYGPNVDGYEYDRWGTYHRATHKTIGIDRSSTGTGYATQYFKDNAEKYEHIETCPEELLLFFHAVAYDYELSSGKTIIQHIYDTHFEGVKDVESMIILWKTLKGKVSDKKHERVIKRLNMQLENATEWRDIVNSYFYRKTMVEDESGRIIY